MAKFINLSNHPSSKWSEEQIAAAKELVNGGEIVDMEFPRVPPDADEAAVSKLAERYLVRIHEIAGPRGAVVHLMGEMGFCSRVVRWLREDGYIVVYSTTERVQDEAGRPVFRFVRFREYL